VRTTRGRDLDIGGLNYARLESQGPQQWPCRDGDAEGTARLYADCIFPTADGRARFAAVPYRPVAEQVDARYPLRMTTGRLRDQWHGMSRTGLVSSLYAHAPEPALELNAADAHRRNLAAGELVRVESRRGAVTLPLAFNDEIKTGGAFVPMHWGSATLAGRGGSDINAVTAKAFCPTSKQPELKHAAIRVVKTQLPWRLVAFGVPAVAESLPALRADARATVAGFEHASVVLVHGAQPGVLVRAATALPFTPEALACVDRAFGLDASAVARYDDPRRHIGRRLRVVDGRLAAVRLSGDIQGSEWLREWMSAQRDVGAFGAALLMPSPQPPGGARLRGRTVCACHDVADSDIVARLAALAGAAEPALATVQRELKCGTSCGSCLPELRRLASTQRGAA
jgi:assimilatory nitrate reductase catalytic subunit